MEAVLNQIKILIIEDDDSFNLWISLVMTRLEITNFHQVATAEEALLYLEDQSPDLIICDIYLEGQLTGIDFLKKIQILSIPIIIMTSSTSISLYREVQMIERVVYLVKPFQPITFIAAIESVLRGVNSFSNSMKLKEPSLLVRLSNNKNTKIYFSDIIYLESDGNYTYLFTQEKKIALKKSLIRTMAELDSRFIRCHKTYGVNRSYVLSWSSMQIELRPIGMPSLPIGRSYQKTFESEMKLSL